MTGIADLIALLLGLSGFGLQTNPRPPTVDASLEYAIPEADVVLHLDAASIIPGNYRKLAALPDDPQIKASPELSRAVRQVVTEVDSARGLVKTMSGIDLATDVADATAFVRVKRMDGDADGVVAVHGKFTAATIDKIAGMSHKTASKVGAASYVEVDNQNVLALTGNGVLVFGSKDLVVARLQPGYKGPGHAPGSSLGYAAEMLAGKPVFGISVTLSQAGRDAALKGLGQGTNLATDLVRRGKNGWFALYHDGIGWSWADSTPNGLEAMTEMSNGLVDLLRAGQIAPRGVAKIFFGVVDSYRGTREADQVIQHKAELMKLVDTYIGDGTFKAKVDADKKTLKLSVRLTGKSASEVIGLGALVPVGAFLFFGAREGSSTQPISAPAKIAAPPLPPTTKRK